MKNIILICERVLQELFYVLFQAVRTHIQVIIGTEKEVKKLNILAYFSTFLYYPTYLMLKVRNVFLYRNS